MRIKRKALAGTLRILRESQADKLPYTVGVAGKQFVVHRKVFSPRYFRDTAFFARSIPYPTGGSFCEIGPGSGVITVLAVLNGARQSTAVDINPACIRCTSENAQRHGVSEQVTLYIGNVYDPLPKDARFDLIFWNTPFALIPDGNPTILERAVIDPGYEATRSFISGASAHLAPNGRLLIGFSTTLGHFLTLQQIARESGYRLRKLAETNSVEAMPVKFQLFEAVKS